ncbi:hypothetical protein [Kitasatospora phosalacinea]|uniref:hypothetical protein n=1 Tax=Kitasatospora phosalacinea TaxID=2065 RepID=UPI0009DFEDBD|nr:hypothetical protein [Kitasatospora phosalacinea]
MTYPPQPGAPAPGQPPYQQQPYPQAPYQQAPYQQQQPYPVQQFPPYGVPGQQPPPPPRRGGAGRTLACLGVSLVVLLGVAVGGVVVLRAVRQPPKMDALKSDTEPWQKLTKGLTDALAAKDEEAFVKPFAAGATKEKQRKVFRNLVKIPWATARWESSLVIDGRLTVDFVHQVKGVDNYPISERYEWRVLGPDTKATGAGPETAVPEGAEVVTEVGGPTDNRGKTMSDGYYPSPWDAYDELSVQVRDHLVVMSDKGQEAELNRDADVLARAAKDDLDAWQKCAPAPTGKTKGAEGFFVVLEKNRDVYNKLYQGDGKPDDSLEAGVNMSVWASSSAQPDPGRPVIGGSRIVIDTTDGRFTGKQWQEGVTNIGRHEMAHATVATLVSSDGTYAPTDRRQDWVAEGFGEYMALRGKDDRAREDLAVVKQVSFDGKLPGDGEDFYSFDAARRSANYALAGDALRYMASKYGDAKVCGFVAAQYTRPKEYEQQIAAATGQPLDQFQSAWAAHVRATASVRR